MFYCNIFRCFLVLVFVLSELKKEVMTVETEIQKNLERLLILNDLLLRRIASEIEAEEYFKLKETVKIQLKEIGLSL